MDETPSIIASPLVDVGPLVDVLTEPTLSELLDSPGSKGYLSHLATLPLAELTKEPVTLQTQSHYLTSSLTSFTHTSYPTFISLHKNTTSFASSIESLSSSLTDLLDQALPTLEESTRIWKTRTETVLRERNKARVVLEQHDKIRDLLDIPVLIDTCVRNGYFGEALSLANHVTSLVHRADDKKDQPPPAILTSVLAEVQHSITQMHLSLIATLYEPNRKLPALWKAVNFLRKMEAFASDGSSSPFNPLLKLSQREVPTRRRPPEPSSEEQLALAFLIGREACLKAALEATGRDIQRLMKQVHNSEEEGDDDTNSAATKEKLKGKTKELDDRDKEDLARYLKKYVDAWREGVYDVVTQYATIFLERSPAHSETSTITNDQDGVLLSRLHTLLRTYSTRALSTHLLAMLKPSLPLLTLSHLPSLLTQLTYCSTAFSRLGLDFRCILTGGGGLFSNTILSIVKRDFETATEAWVSRVEKAHGAVPSKNDTSRRVTSASSSRTIAGPAELPSKWLVSPADINSPPCSPSLKGAPAHIPPQLLASYPPIAQLTNAVLGVLNGLRLVVPRDTSPSLPTANGITPFTSTPTSAEGVYTLLQILDETILNRTSTALLTYLKFAVKFLEGDDTETLGEKQKTTKEIEVKIVVASGKVFFDVFTVFVRRALVEGVYGIEFSVDGVGKERGIKESGRGQKWVDRKKEFERMVKDLYGGGEDKEEEEEEEDDEKDEEEEEEESEEEEEEEEGEEEGEED